MPAVIVVVDAIEPGAMNVDGVLNVTEPVDAEAVIWLVVPAIAVTPVLAIVIEPEALVTEIAVPAVSVDKV